MGWNDDVLRLVRRVPQGRVATYGQIAALLGRPRGGREVGWALHACGGGAPCHRVVNRDGRLAPHFGVGGPAEQRARLEAEGVTFRGALVDLERHRWRPQRRPAARPL